MKVCLPWEVYDRPSKFFGTHDELQSICRILQSAGFVILSERPPDLPDDIPRQILALFSSKSVIVFMSNKSASLDYAANAVAGSFALSFRKTPMRVQTMDMVEAFSPFGPEAHNRIPIRKAALLVWDRMDLAGLSKVRKFHEIPSVIYDRALHKRPTLITCKYYGENYPDDSRLLESCLKSFEAVAGEALLSVVSDYGTPYVKMFNTPDSDDAVVSREGS
jgi:hypothetical protein